MTVIRQYTDLVSFGMRSMRAEIWFVMMIQTAFSAGLVIGFGYVIPNVSDTTALYLITGSVAQAIVTIGLVVLPQSLAQAKAEGRLDYMLTLPISREAYLVAQVTLVGIMALPGVVFAAVLGFWHYGIAMQPDPILVIVVPLAIFSLAGIGVAMAVVIPHQQITNALTQLIIFYVLFFAPVILPKEQLPWLLRQVSVVMPPTYVADAVRASLTDLPNTHIGRALIVMAMSSAVSLGISSAAVRRRG
jgi:ABC-2 type transport system permease protein